MTKTPICALPSTLVVGRRKRAALTLVWPPALRFAVTTTLVVGWSCAPAEETSATVASKANRQCR